MVRIRHRAWLLLVGLVASATGARAADVGVTAVKLIVVDKIATAGTAKAVFVSKDVALPAIAGLGAIEIGYSGTGSALGAFLLPASSEWLDAPSGTAKYVNKAAPSGGAIKVAVFKEGRLAKMSAKALGDAPFFLDLFSAGVPSSDGGIRVTISFPETFGVTERYCSQFAVDLGSTVAFKEIAGGAGRKLVAKGGVPATCAPKLCASHSPFDDGPGTGLGNCGGLCPAGLTCVSTLAEPDDIRPCECVDPNIPCGDALFPTCLGTCPDGEQCNSFGIGECGCGPIGTRCELAGDYPTCGGVCAAGLTCQPMFDSACGCGP